MNLPLPRLFLLLGLLAGAGAHAGNCPADTAPQLLDARFASMVRSQLPQDRLLYLPAGAREVYVHATTRGQGRITYRWFRDGKRVIDVGAGVGKGEWHTWSRLRLPPPAPGVVQVQILSAADGCLLRELTLPGTAWVDQPRIREALAALAADDAIGAKIALNTLLEEQPAAALARTARQLLETDVAIARARAQVASGEVFLVEESLRAVERKLGRSSRDQALRERIAEVRRLAGEARVQLRRDDAHMAIATRHLLETEKLFTGDYPLWREQAEQLVNPALVHAGNDFVLVDWQPTLRGYRLVLQDKRSGEAFEVTPE